MSCCTWENKIKPNKPKAQADDNVSTRLGYKFLWLFFAAVIWTSSFIFIDFQRNFIVTSISIIRRWTRVSHKRWSSCYAVWWLNIETCKLTALTTLSFLISTQFSFSIKHFFYEWDWGVAEGNKTQSNIPVKNWKIICDFRSNYFPLGLFWLSLKLIRLVSRASTDINRRWMVGGKILNALWFPKRHNHGKF